MVRSSEHLLRSLCEGHTQSDKDKKYTFSPAELSSERGEKEVLADSTQLGGGAAAINAVARELLRSACLPGREKMAPEGISSTTGRALLQSMLVSADDSCHCPHRPTPLLLCAPPMVCLSVSLALSLSRLYAFKNVTVFNVHNMLPIQGEQWRHPRLSASFMWVFPMTCRFSRVPVGRLVHLI